VPCVDRVADGLADEVVADGKAIQIERCEQIPLGFAVAVVGEGFVDFEVVAPAGEFEAVVAPVRCHLAERFEREVGPLSGEKCDGSWHGFGSSVCPMFGSAYGM